MQTPNQTELVIDLLIKKISELESSLNSFGHRLALIEQITSEVTRVQGMEQQMITQLKTEQQKIQIGLKAISIRQSSQNGGESNSGSQGFSIRP